MSVVFETEKALIEIAVNLTLDRIIRIYDRYQDGDLTGDEAAELASLVRAKVKKGFA